MIFWISLILTLSYIILVLWYIRGWVKLKEDHDCSEQKQSQEMTIIIPVRNEAASIENTIRDLASQDYCPEKFEILIVNDQSDDRTAEIAAALMQQMNMPNCRLLCMPKEAGQGKKAAISYGVENASYEWIITTDADCRRGKKWLSSIADFLQCNDGVMISCPVLFENEKTAFAKMQSLEFLSLIGIGAASIANRRPTMCNGANLVFSKAAFYKVGGYEGSAHIASGDDEFLMHKMAKQFPGKILFLKNTDATVYSEAMPDVKSFLNQRKRWVSKSTKYKNPIESLMALLVWLMHLFLMINLLIAPFRIDHLYLFLASFLLKLFIELGFIIPLSRFFRKSSFLLYYPLAAFLYIFYVSIIPVLAQLSSYEWKGRKFNKV